MAKEVDLEFVDYVIKALVDKPDKVEVKRSIDERGVLIELTVDPTDMGKVIGKNGQTAKSVRTLLRVIGAKNNARVNLKIIEPQGGKTTTQSAESKPTEETKKSLEEELGV